MFINNSQTHISKGYLGYFKEQVLETKRPACQSCLHQLLAVITYATYTHTTIWDLNNKMEAISPFVVKKMYLQSK